MVKNPPFNAGDTGSIPGRGTKIPHAVQRGQKKNLLIKLKNLILTHTKPISSAQENT